MKKRIFTIFVAVVLLLTPSLAFARQYIIPDSDTRQLTEAELQEWSYLSLGYILNEIFARHGYVFESGGNYDTYFSNLYWYTPNTNPDNQTMVYKKLTSVEWYNEGLIKDVRAEMAAAGDYNTEGLNYLDYISDKLYGNEICFTYTSFDANQTFDVYSAPKTSSYRGANNKACVSTNDSLYVAGWENGWLLVMYRTSGSAVRVGYINKSEIKDAIDASELLFNYTTITCSRNVYLTDDPVTGGTAIVKLEKGEQATYLASYYDVTGWVYVETQVNGKTVRGFIPENAVE